VKNLKKKITKIFKEFTVDEENLIPILQKIQAEIGYISKQGVEEIANFLRITEGQVYGVASFYSQFRFTAPGRHSIKVCLGTACHVRGSQNILEEFKRWLLIEPGETTEDKMFSLETVNCVGACALGPIVIFDNEYHGHMRIKSVDELIQKYRTEYETEREVDK